MDRRTWFSRLENHNNPRSRATRTGQPWVPRPHHRSGGHPYFRYSNQSDSGRDPIRQRNAEQSYRGSNGNWNWNRNSFWSGLGRVSFRAPRNQGQGNSEESNQLSDRDWNWNRNSYQSGRGFFRDPRDQGQENSEQSNQPPNRDWNWNRNSYQNGRGRVRDFFRAPRDQGQENSEQSNQLSYRDWNGHRNSYQSGRGRVRISFRTPRDQWQENSEQNNQLSTRNWNWNLEQTLETNNGTENNTSSDTRRTINFRVQVVINFEQQENPTVENPVLENPAVESLVLGNLAAEIPEEEDDEEEEVEGIQENHNGYSEETIWRCLRGEFYKKSANQEAETCVVCQEEFEENVLLGILDCKHSYHLGCIERWLLRNMYCPLCRQLAFSEFNLVQTLP